MGLLAPFRLTGRRFSAALAEPAVHTKQRSVTLYRINSSTGIASVRPDWGSMTA